MKAYLFQMRNAFLSRFKYRSNMFWGFLRGIIVVLPQIFLWKALYHTQKEVSGVTLTQMMTYVVVNILVSQGMNLQNGRAFEERMKSGDVCLDMIRPTDPRILTSFTAVGEAIVNILIRGVPVFLISIIIAGGIQLPASWVHGILFLVSAVLALVLNVVFQILIGVIAFWFLSVWLIDWMMRFFESLFSGGIVPLWFMPLWIQGIAVWLPFQSMRFTPVQIYLGKLSAIESSEAILQQLIWIIILILAQQVLWNKGVKRIIVLGG